MRDREREREREIHKIAFNENLQGTNDLVQPIISGRIILK
jgi:hypothetical protein